MEELSNGNGRYSWLRWINTVLILLVGGLLGLYVSGTDRRLIRLEDEMLRQERLTHLEARVDAIAYEEARRGARLDAMHDEVDILKAYHRSH